MNTWFTSDTHFGHANIMGYCDRPWDDVRKMDADMVDTWQSLILPEDTVFHLGDFCWGGPARMEELLSVLPGHKHLIVGNHDPTYNRCSRVDGWESVHKYLETVLDDILVVLSHYPLEEWNRDLEGSFHLHGHCHGTRPSYGTRRLDVGVDPWDYEPIPWEQVKKILECTPPPKPPSAPYKPRP
jgi:calcineurin-like phosphoesterase family protein